MVKIYHRKRVRGCAVGRDGSGKDCSDSLFFGNNEEFGIE